MSAEEAARGLNQSMKRHGLTGWKAEATSGRMVRVSHRAPGARRHETVICADLTSAQWFVSGLQQHAERGGTDGR